MRHYNYADEFGARECRTCGCTDDDCQQCVERFGEPCYWVEDDLCSGCHLAVAIDARAAELAACLHTAKATVAAGGHDTCTCFDHPIVSLDAESEAEARWLSDVICDREPSWDVPQA